MFFGSIVIAWLIIVRMPSDYLTRGPDAPQAFRSRHPVARLIMMAARNVIGIVLLLVGLVMLVTPGQGLLFMFLGLTMVDFPRKTDLIRRMLGRPKLIAVINRIRHGAGKPPLKTFDDVSHDDA